MKAFHILQDTALGGEGSGGGGAPPADPPPTDPPPTDPPPAAASGDFVFPENWKEGLDEDLRNDPSLGPITDMPGLVKSFVHAQRQMGKDRAVLPDTHSTPEQWTEMFQKLGLPQKIEEYQINLPEGANFQDGFLSQLKEVGFKAGILPSQMEQFIGWYAQANKEATDAQLTQFNQKTEEAMTKLKSEWGQAYEEKRLLAKNVLKASGIENVNSFMDESGWGDDPMLVKIFAALGGMMKEDTIVEGAGKGTPTPKDVQSSIDSMMGDPKHALHDNRHPSHKSAVKEMEGLFAALHPEASGQ